MDKDFYKTLGVEKNATDDEIKKSYRRFAQKYHPDKNPGDKEAEKKFKEASEAYETLSDPQKRKQYDMFGTAGGGFNGGGQGYGGFPGGVHGEGVDFGDMGGFSDIFESFFGGQQRGGNRRAQGPKRGNDIEARVTLDYTEAFSGTTKELELTKPVTCDTCNGTKVAPGSKMITCPTCKGQGSVRRVQQTILGNISTQSACQACRGTGQYPEKVCGSCKGEGRITKKERVTVRIPAGVDNDSIIRVDGKGEGGIQGGSAGDLFIHIALKKHPTFKRDGADTYSALRIHVLQAILGDEVEVETLHGTVKLKIPSGTEHGKRFKLSGYGMPIINRHESFGDHYVEVQLDIPNKLSRKEEELYNELTKEAKLDVKKKKGLFG